MNRHTTKIMVVDDERLIRWSIASRCKRKGFQVVCVESGEEALDAMRSTPIHIMILDVKLPGIDGVTTLSRALRSNPALAVIMMSAHSTDDVVKLAMKQGARDFLVKPFPFEVLDSAVERILAMRPRPRPAGNGDGTSTESV